VSDQTLMCRVIPRPIAPPNNEGLLGNPLFEIASDVPCLVRDVVAIAENWREMLASQRTNRLNIGESHWPNLEINPLCSSAYLMQPRRCGNTYWAVRTTPAGAWETQCDHGWADTPSHFGRTLAGFESSIGLANRAPVTEEGPCRPSLSWMTTVIS
jgi:hypothetical protein